MSAPTEALDLAIAAMRAAEADPFDLVKAEEMLRGYHLRWSDEPGIVVLDVEREFVAPLVNPSTGASSKTFERGGKIDVMARIGEDDTIIEHKTSSEDLSAGSIYWQRLRMNTQVASYMVGARALGYTPRSVMFDVLGKVGLKPCKATPPEKRKYTKPTKAEPVSRLHAGQREHDETPEEYRQRVRAHIAEDPNGYYARGLVVRTDDDEADSAADDWQVARLIREAETLGRYPRNPGSCQSYGSTCEYLDVCTRLVAIDDPERFVKGEKKHAELEGKGRLPIVSNSELSTFRSCMRKHHYAYRLGYRPHESSDPLRFGTLIHVGLEAWWNCLKASQIETAETLPAPSPGEGPTAADESNDGEKKNLAPSLPIGQDDFPFGYNAPAETQTPAHLAATKPFKLDF